MACKAITGALQSAPTIALEAMYNLTPLHILIEAKLSKYCTDSLGTQIA